MPTIKQESKSGARPRSTTVTRRGASSSRGTLAKVSASALKAELDRRLAKLERERVQLERKLATIEAEIARHTYGHGASARAGTGKRPRNAMNLVEALQKVLKRRTLSVTDMSIAVQEAGYRTTSPNFRTIVNQTLINHPKLFKRVARGKYTAR